MRAHLLGRLIVAAGVGLASPACREPAEPPPRVVLHAPSDFTLGFDGPGRLATIWNWGAEIPWQLSAVVVTEAGRSRRVPIADPASIRWLSSQELLIASVPHPAGVPGPQLLVVDPAGRILRVVTEDRQGIHRIPAPDGRAYAHTRWDEGGRAQIVVTSSDVGLHTLATGGDDLSADAWSPDGGELVASRLVTSPPEGGIAIRMYRLPRDLSSATAIHDGPPGGPPARLGARPLWWAREGIYARIEDGVSLCDPGGGGCRAVYAPRAGFVVGGTPAGAGVALVLVADPEPDAGEGETRAREIHRVDLATGRGTRLHRTPEGVYVTEIAWTAAPES